MRFKKFRQAVAGALAVFMFMFSPACDYAGAVEACAEVASGSDAEVADAAAEDGLGGFDDGAGEYMPDNILSRYEESFEYCPETVPSPYARIALADDVVVVIVALLAMCGIYVGSNSDLVHQIASGFDTYVRRTAGNVKSVMEAWAAVLSAEAGKTIEGIKALLPYLRGYLKSFFTGYGTGSLEYSFSTSAGVLSDGPYHPALNADNYVCSVIGYDNGNIIHDIKRRDIGMYDADYPLAVFSNSDGGQYLYVAYLAEQSSGKSVFVQNSPHYATRTYVPSDHVYEYSDGFSDMLRIAPVGSTAESAGPYYQNIANSCTLPFFKSADYARAFVKYGTMDGLVKPTDDYVFTVPNAWTQLQQDVSERFGNALTLPSTPEEWAAIQSRLASAATAAEALNALSKVIEISSSGGSAGTAPYLHLSYVLDAVSVYAGAGALSADVRNGFLKGYLNITSDGATVEQLNTWAQTVVNSQVAITGKDEDNDKNSFVITAALAAALLEYLYAQNLLEAIPDIAAGTQVRENVRVADKAVTPPDGGGSADLSGILSIISSILAAVGGLPALIATEAIKALASSAFANGITLNLDSIRASIGQIAQWDFADWTGALGSAVLLALKSFAIDFRLDGLADALDSIARWDFADWDIALGSAIKAALTALGFDKAIGLVDVLEGWDFSDWSAVFRSVLDAALAASGLSGLAGILSDIKLGLKDLGINIDLSPLTDTLAGLKDAVIAIPGEVTDFFTLDMAAINTAYADLTVAFKGRFSGLYALSSVFGQEGRTFEDTPPVFTMPVPDALKIAFPDTDTIVIMDLRQYASIFQSIRLILTAALWYMFAVWMLGQFDVKFHIG